MSPHTSAPTEQSLGIPQEPASSSPSPGFVPQGYDAIGLVGKGAFSEVWKIRDRSSNRCYALKHLRPEWAEDATANHLLSNEARIGHAVRSPHIVRIIHSTAELSGPHTILEWLDGETLEEKLIREGRLPSGLAVWIIRQCTVGLEELERAGFCHGDIKPANIFLTADAGVKLIDLGFARPTRSSQQTRGGNLMTGTVEYLAPEVVSRVGYNAVTEDVYGLGVTLYRMLAGKLPFEAANVSDILRLQRQAIPARIGSIRNDIPPMLEQLVFQMLAKQPIRRHQSHRSLLRELLDIELATLPDRFPASPVSASPSRASE